MVRRSDKLFGRTTIRPNASTNSCPGTGDNSRISALLLDLSASTPQAAAFTGCVQWNSVFRRFSRWSRKGVWQRMFQAMSDDPDFEYLIVDSTTIRAHQHASGAKKGG